MRVLHILDHSIPLQSGYAFRTLAILREQRALGWETAHLTGPKQEGCMLLEERVDGWHFYRTPPNSTAISGIPGMNEVRIMGEITHRLEQVVKTVRPHVLHAHSPVLNAIPALRVGHRLRLPVVYEVRAFWEDAAVDHGTAKEWGIRYRLTRALETFALKRADAVTTICEGLKRDIVARGIAQEKVTVIPNAVDIDQFSIVGTADSALKRSLGLEEGAPVLGFIGSFYAYEGLGLLLEALPCMLAENPKIRVLLVGGGPDEVRLRARVQELGLTNEVVFTGRVPHKEVKLYYDLVDVLVYPRISRRLTELVTPLKPLEAMAQGKLLVASDVGGHRELIEHGRTGILFKAGDPAALARAAMGPIQTPSLWQSLRQSARSFVEVERGWTTTVARYGSVYEKFAR